MQRARNLRRVLGLLMAICLLTGLLPVTAMAASSPAPAYADWDDTTAMWSEPEGEYEKIRYHISLFKLTDGYTGTQVPISGDNYYSYHRKPVL